MEIILGCGSSMGVPDLMVSMENVIQIIKNTRLRCSALLKTKNENVLIDTLPV